MLAAVIELRPTPELERFIEREIRRIADEHLASIVLAAFDWLMVEGIKGAGRRS